MKKAVLTALLAAVCIMFFALYPVSAEQNSGSWLYELTSEGLVITGFEGTDSDVVIPDEIDGYKVSVIGSHAFADNHTMKTLVIPEGITSIRGKLFTAAVGCRGLNSMPGTAQFRMCGSMTAAKEQAYSPVPACHHLMG